MSNTARLEVVPTRKRDANALVAAHHRHHKPVMRGCIFSVGLAQDGALVGAVIVGRPVARQLCDGRTVEVLRCVVPEGVPNACSMLYGAAWRAARALGWTRLVTYTLPDESGSSLRGAGWRLVGEAGGGSWHRDARPRVDSAPVVEKLRWEVMA